MPRIAASLAVLITAVTCIGFNTARYPAVWHMAGGNSVLASSDRADDPAATTQSAAAPQPETLARSAPRAASETGRRSGSRSDRQPDVPPSSPAGWESATVEPGPASGEHGGLCEAGIASSPEYSYDELAADDGNPRAGEHGESGSASGNDSPARFDPVAPQDRSVGGPTARNVEPVEAASSARYASYSPGPSGAVLGAPGLSAGDAPASSEANEQTEVVPPSTLVPVEPARNGAGDESLASRPWADSLSLPDRVGPPGASEVIPLPPVDEIATVAAPESQPGGTGDAIRIYPSTGIE